MSFNFFGFFKSAWSKLLGLFKTFINEALSDVQQIFIAEFKDIAATIIYELTQSDLSSGEKRTAAFNRIKQEVIKSGKDASDSLIYLLIELVYQKVKKTTV